MANHEPMSLGRVRMLCQMERLLAIKVLADRNGWDQNQKTAFAKLLDSALEPAHARLIAEYDKMLDEVGPHREERWEQEWNRHTEKRGKS